MKRGGSYLSNPPGTYPNRIREHRARLGLTQTQLAAQVGLTQGTLQKIESGTMPLAQTYWTAFVKALGCPLIGGPRALIIWP